MASSTSNTTAPLHHVSATYGSDPSSPNTTFVQADQSTFRTIVQKLTGAPDDPSAQKLPLSHHHPNRPTAIPGPKRPAFKLHERRQSAKNLQINLNNNFDHHDQHQPHHFHHLFHFRQQPQRGFLVSPVSTLDFFASSRPSPRELDDDDDDEEEEEEEEERAIAEKGFYLHPSPLSTPRGADPPELLPLFPLCSPEKAEEYHEDNNDCNSCS